MRRLGFLLLSVGLLATNSSCFRYVEARPEAVVSGSDVRVRVSFDRAVELEDLLDQDDPRELNGTTMDYDEPGWLRLSVPFQGVEAGSARRGFNSVVDISFMDLERVQLREVDWTKTGGLVALSAVVAGALVEAVFDPFDGEEGDGEPGETEAAIIPLFSIRW